MLRHFLVGLINLLVFPAAIVDNGSLAVIRHQDFGKAAESFIICTWAESQDLCFMSRNDSTYAYWL